MKNYIYAFSLSAMLVTSVMGSASANTGIIKFSGAISSSTCNMNVVVNGVTSPTGVVDLGIYKVSDATAVGEFGTATNLSLTPDLASCDISPAGADAMLKIDAAQSDATNTSVVTNLDSATTNVGVLFELASGTAVVNKGSVNLASGSADLDADGGIHFTAQPYALSATIAPGTIGGSVAYTVAYL